MIINNLPKTTLNRFIQLSNDLSPENLSCDGELSQTEIRSKQSRISQEWKALEKEWGHSVSQESIEEYICSRL